MGELWRILGIVLLCIFGGLFVGVFAASVAQGYWVAACASAGGIFIAAVGIWGATSK